MYEAMQTMYERKRGDYHTKAGTVTVYHENGNKSFERSYFDLINQAVCDEETGSIIAVFSQYNNVIVDPHKHLDEWFYPGTDTSEDNYCGSISEAVSSYMESVSQKDGRNHIVEISRAVRLPTIYVLARTADDDSGEEFESIGHTEGKFRSYDTLKIAEVRKRQLDERDAEKSIALEPEAIPVSTVYQPSAPPPESTFIPIGEAAEAAVSGLSLELGKFYKSRTGIIYGPLEAGSDHTYKFKGKQTDNSGAFEVWTKRGNYYHAGSKSLHDLIEEVADPRDPVSVNEDGVKALLARPIYPITEAQKANEPNPSIDELLDTQTELQIVEGHYYMRKDGKIAGPARLNPDSASSDTKWFVRGPAHQVFDRDVDYSYPDNGQFSYAPDFPLTLIEDNGTV